MIWITKENQQYEILSFKIECNFSTPNKCEIALFGFVSKDDRICLRFAEVNVRKKDRTIKHFKSLVKGVPEG